MSQRVCHFHNKPGGCRRGSQCQFLHPGLERNVGSSSPQTPSSSRPPPRGNSPSFPPPTKAPSGVCSYYWTTGRCKREFACRFKHTLNPVGPHRATSPSSPLQSQTDAILPFLNEGGLAKVTGLGTDVFFPSTISSSLSPNDAHNALKRFLHDDFRFRTTLEIYSFLATLSSATATNSSWGQEDGQLLLSSIATDNGLLRIGDVIRWAPVSTRAGSDRAVLSFQRGVLPLLRYMSSEFVVKSTLSSLVNALYMRILQDFDHFSTTIEECMDAIIAARSFKDPKSMARREPILGSQVLASMTGVFYECLTRIKNVVITHPRLIPLVRKLHGWMEAWLQGIAETPPAFDDPFGSTDSLGRDHITGHLRNKVDRLVAIIDREQRKIDNTARPDRFALVSSGTSRSSEGVIAALQNSYQGPGTDRADGPRHDNDYIEIARIRIAPTHEELISRSPPFLPANLHDAPHPFPFESMERLLDIQFRLLREELTAPLRTSVQLVRDDLSAPRWTKTKLSDLIQKGGGKYRGHGDGQDGIMFNVYTNVTFVSLVPDRRGISTGLRFDSPPGRARSPQTRARVAFWEGIGGKRLMQGGLIALIWKRGSDIAVHLGILASSQRDLTDSAKRGPDQVAARVVFFDASLELRILEALKYPENHRSSTMVLVEAPVMFEAIRPFLEALRVEPESIPFGKHLVHHPPGFFKSVKIPPPAYALVPGFEFQLSSLFPPDSGVQDLKLSVTDAASIEVARHELREHSRLDPSQADATLDVLTRELALVQGPPGTGKSFTGVEILRVLLANKVRPILMIAFTNHALDHMLCSVLDANITKKVVRLGSRSADERVSQYSIETMEMVAGQSRLDRAFGRNHRILKDIEEEIRKLMVRFLRVSIESYQIVQHLELQYPEHYEHIIEPPQWIFAVRSSSDDEGWRLAGRKGQSEAVDNSMYAFWRTGKDLEFLQRAEDPFSSDLRDLPDPEPVHQNRFDILADVESRFSNDDSGSELDNNGESEHHSDDAPEERWMHYISPLHPEEVPEVQFSANPGILSPKLMPAIPTPPEIIHASDLRNSEDFFLSFGLDGVPLLPSSDRSLEELLCNGEMWSMTMSERKRLHMYWNEVVRLATHKSQLEEFERLRERHADAQRMYNEGKDEARRQLLRNVDIVGCTTTGAAKLTSLLKGLSPRVMLVEEAGQVLEAHVLGSLVPSVEHLILIGDPLQLRPTLNNYHLSIDSRRGSELYKFDMSLMERLSKSGLPMSRIDIQRRMRPAISNLIRTTLYPGLEDHDLVKQYPSVRGFAKNVFFLSHSHKENGGFEESASRYNMYEVNMIKDLVLYLLRQGIYSQEGDIVVLCAYLGQLARVRDALSGEVAVIIDDRDQIELADREDEREDLETAPCVEHVTVTKRVRLRTVDNYQGEEAKVVILSLVRNSGDTDDDMDILGHSSGGVRANIGFLKSENRTNVALSRAKEGLFILGNAINLASRSRMWHAVIDELEKNDAIGDAFPIVCHHHPDAVEFVSEPGRLPRLSPDGGCLRPCDSRLKCGHLCPYKCHPDDPNHFTVACVQPCRRLCARGHPCNKQCSDACGACEFVVHDVLLPCGHTKPSVPCHLVDSLENVLCSEILTKQLPTCEHTAQLTCSQDPGQYLCRAICMCTMVCCGRDCNSHCYRCQEANEPRTGSPHVPRVKHHNHRCQRTLNCQHPCQNPCSQDHKCTTICKEPCRQACSHAVCKDYCSTPCAPCQEPCAWTCPHYTCPVPCGSACARLPCDERCDNWLPCGHKCPSVCGEDCSIQTCPLCASEDLKTSIVDFIMQRTLEDVDLEKATLDELLITIPNCRHVFTVETLDGHCSMSEYYRREGDDGRWLALEAPPSGFRKPPTCPTCRATITSPRYGRIFKPANLGILEVNVASRMCHSLTDIQASVDSITMSDIDTSLARTAAAIKASRASPSLNLQKQRNRNRSRVLKESRDEPVAWDALNPENKDFHGAFPSAAKAWRQSVQQLIHAYVQATKVAATRSAHVRAWEAAFSCLYEQEMELAFADPTNAPRRPSEHAMRVARMKVGQPQPRADKRFLVEAFWITLNVRFMLAALTIKWLEALRDRATLYPETDCHIWATFIGFLLRTCVRDAELALDIARESESHRQVIKTASFVMRAHLEQFRFDIKMCRQCDTSTSAREELIERTVLKARTAEQYRASILEGWHRALGRSPTPEATSDRLELKNQFSDTAQTIIKEYSNVEESLRSDTFYQPVSLEEKTAIVRALNFSHTGHFYNCPNGHTFVITECGGANQRALCPECGAAIGGTNHTLDATNTRANDLEEIARGQGAQRSPWSWGT